MISPILVLPTTILMMVSMSQWTHAFRSTLLPQTFSLSSSNVPLSSSSSSFTPPKSTITTTTTTTRLGVQGRPPLSSILSTTESDPYDEVDATTTIRRSASTCCSFLDDGKISPHHLIHPEIFHSSSIPFQRRLPLISTLRLIRKAIKSSIIQNHDQFKKKSLPYQTFTTKKQKKILRIEHKISHSVDPLCWLQAQRRINQHREYPTIYFANGEGTLEAASLGSTLHFSGTTEEDAYWEIVSNLPSSTYLYGGQRFDPDSVTISEEWQTFQKGLWILPAVELRKERGSQGTGTKTTTTTTLAVHLVADTDGSFLSSARQVVDMLALLTDACTSMTPPTTLPPVLSRMSTYGENLDGQEIYEKGVTAAVQRFSTDPDLKKVVLARRMDLSFSRHASDNIDALDVLRKWKFAAQPGGHMFLLSPGIGGGLDSSEFFGCTPERLFLIDKGKVLSEALAGTRPRGATPEDDATLSRQLFQSSKDQSENLITGNFIRDVFQRLEGEEYIKTSLGVNGTKVMSGDFFIRRLRHLQHICQRFQCSVAKRSPADTTRRLLSELHPTPAVGGFPKKAAIEFIRDYESFAFDRGFYAGPVGAIGRDYAELVVAIRSGLLTKTGERPKLSVFAGAGIVPGSTVQGEWAETSYKLGVVSSIFPQAPITLQSATTPNAAWATAFVEELIRNGVTQFYISPGSRSTPLVAAIAKAVRSNVGIVRALSIHDERGASFRAVGYGRGNGRPAAVVTSSGTAVANLYPAIVEASMDGVPMIILTADRPYESRNTGANQAIDQMKIFSDTYVRWFRDIISPSDTVPVSLVLADAAHAVSLSKSLRGPVHLNVQFRENLAPVTGPIRSDDRKNAITKYDAMKFTESPGFQRWSLGGNRWLNSYATEMNMRYSAVNDIGNLIAKSKRGIIVVGNLRKDVSGGSMTGDISDTVEIISSFAQSIGFPILASALTGTLRFESACVVPFAETILKSPKIREHLNPDLVLQFGAPLISTEIQGVIKSTMRESSIHHVLVHPYHSSERADPEFTVSYNVNADIGKFVRSLGAFLDELPDNRVKSELTPIVGLGRILQKVMPNLVKEAADDVLMKNGDRKRLSEPELTMAMSRVFSDVKVPELSLFISNSMPIRDSEAFLYPTGEDSSYAHGQSRLKDTGVNRGASGIDGIISSASGFADATNRPTTLMIGDVAALHDINSLHALQTSSFARDAESHKNHPLTTIVLNNDGGGIFSFLPIADFGTDVGFEEYFGTPTRTFSFQKGAEAFGLSYEKAEDVSTFEHAYSSAVMSGSTSLIEAIVATREENVAVHKEITKRTNALIESILNQNNLRVPSTTSSLPIREYHAESDSYLNLASYKSKKMKTMVLLHGWMGDKSEWDDIGNRLAENLKGEWRVISLDLPGHGDSALLHSTPGELLRSCLRLDDDMDSVDSPDLGLDAMATKVERTIKEAGIDAIDAVVGYSLGGRVALAMKRASLLPGVSLVSGTSKLILLSTYPGNLAPQKENQSSVQDRLRRDDQLSTTISSLFDRTMFHESKEDSTLVFSDFLGSWYGAPLWGSMKEKPRFKSLVAKRARSLAHRGRDHAAVLQQCSPPRCRTDDWRAVQADKTLYISGLLDSKYTTIGAKWNELAGLKIEIVPNAGHALLFEAPDTITSRITDFLRSPRLSQAVKDEVVEIGAGVAHKSFNATQEQQNEASTKLDQSETSSSIDFVTTVASLDFEKFTIDFAGDGNRKSGIGGLGWGKNARTQNVAKKRDGFIIQIMSVDGLHTGVGEIAPLPGLHSESLENAEEQLNIIAQKISTIGSDSAFSIEPYSVLSLDGSLTRCINELHLLLEVDSLLPSVRSGLEMALLSLASQAIRVPLHQAVVEAAPQRYKNAQSANSVGPVISLNGLIPRGGSPGLVTKNQLAGREARIFHYDSWKVKVGHQSTYEDAMAVSYAYRMANSDGKSAGKVRADANRAFDATAALQFAQALKETDVDAFQRLEYVEEPLQRLGDSRTPWTFQAQLEELEKWSDATEIRYALDESLSDLITEHNYDYDAIRSDLYQIVSNNKTGCTALILKPALVGLELSMRLARLARTELGIGAVFTSSFDSGVGLAYTSFLASLSDTTPAMEGVTMYAHGLGTFDLLADDCLKPTFGSYVSSQGKLNVASLSRAFYGLGLDEIRCLAIDPLPTPELSTRVSGLGTTLIPTDLPVKDFDPPEEFEASTSTSSDGREMLVVASLPLPFSAEVACARFTDLPQQPRWSPWISSVAYVDATGETEWRLRIRGVDFRWRAKSGLLLEPYRGIRWESVSGLQNTGAVEFIPTKPGTCLMKVQITFVTPRILSPLFKGTSIFFEDFLRNKVLKWSLEMFRDVVKGDLALEEGNVELGDALYGSVEGKANAIEATLSSSIDKDRYS